MLAASLAVSLSSEVAASEQVPLIAVDLAEPEVPATRSCSVSVPCAACPPHLPGWVPAAIAAGRHDDVAQLVPAYVALPRGISPSRREHGMVARPPLRVRIEPMTLDDIPAVHRIERASFPVPWPDYAFRQEIETNRLAHYLVVRAGSEIVAYGGMWMMVDEAHITTFAVLPEWRRQRHRRAADAGDDAAGGGAAGARGHARGPAVERCRRGSSTQRFGFRPVGIRPRYYSDNGEDALIMTTAPLELGRHAAAGSPRSRAATRTRRSRTTTGEEAP